MQSRPQYLQCTHMWYLQHHFFQSRSLPCIVSGNTLRFVICEGSSILCIVCFACSIFIRVSGLYATWRKKRPRCKSLCSMFCQPLAGDYFISVEAEAAANVKRLTSQGWRRHKVEQRAVRASGPILAVTDLAGTSHSVGLKCRPAF